MFEWNEQLDGRLNGLFVQAMRYGDRSAMDEFVALSLPALTKRVTSWCDKRGLSCGFADIVASMTLVKALGAFETFDANKQVMAWLVAIARNELANCYRVAQRLDRLESLDARILPVSQRDDRLNRVRGRHILTPLQELVRREDDARRKRQGELLDAAIASLPELKRRVVELYRSDNTPGVIAVTLGLTPARVHKLLFEAKEELRRRIA